jgi:long-subunit acyl-CoA synthetase (AMP-forming)
MEGTGRSGGWPHRACADVRRSVSGTYIVLRVSLSVSICNTHLLTSSSSYSSFSSSSYQSTYSLAHHLRAELGLKEGDIVAIMSPNNSHYFACFNGIALTGAASTTINPLYTPDEVSYQLDLTRAKAIIAHPICMPSAKAAAGGKVRALYFVCHSLSRSATLTY